MRKEILNLEEYANDHDLFDARSAYGHVIGIIDNALEGADNQ